MIWVYWQESIIIWFACNKVSPNDPHPRHRYPRTLRQLSWIARHADCTGQFARPPFQVLANRTDVGRASLSRVLEQRCREIPFTRVGQDYDDGLTLYFLRCGKGGSGGASTFVSMLICSTALRSMSSSMLVEIAWHSNDFCSREGEGEGHEGIS